MRWGALGSVGLHLLVIAGVLLIAFLTHVKSLEELMRESGSIAQSGPAPEQPMEVVLQPDDVPPPPPTLNPDFIRQIEKPKPVVIPPPQPVVVKKPVVQVKPRYTAPKATGTGESETVSRLVVGSANFPQPGYPYEAQARRQTGTVLISIQFDGSGNAADVSVIQSSGVSILDSSARIFIRSHWKDARFAGQTKTVPIEFTL